MAAMTQVLLSSDEVKQCILQVDDLKKIKDINLMGKKLGLRKFKKTEKSLARQMIVEKLEELQSQLSEFPSPPSTQDSDDEIEQEEDNLVVQVEEPREEMTVPAVEEKPELVDIEKEEEKYDTNKMYQTINEMVEILRSNEGEMYQRIESLKSKNNSLKEDNEKLNESFEDIYKKYELACSKNEKLQKSNDKLKLVNCNLMGDL
jgi:hypothetical protein